MCTKVTVRHLTFLYTICIMVSHACMLFPSPCSCVIYYLYVCEYFCMYVHVSAQTWNNPAFTYNHFLALSFVILEY